MRTRILGAALLSLVTTSVAAQGLMTTRGQVVAKTGDVPTGLPAGVTLGSTTTTVFDTPVMSATGSILVRSKLIGTVTANDDRCLIYGHASGDLRVLLRASDPEPTGLFPNSIVVLTSSGSGLPLGSNTFGSQRIASQTSAPFLDYVMFQTQLYDASGLDGLTNTGANANNQLLYWGVPVPGGLQILARRAITTMPDGAVLIPDTFSHQSTSLTGDGTATFRTTLSQTLGTPSPAVTAANDSAWITGVPGSLNYVIREGDSVAVGGVSPGTVVIGSVGSSNNCVRNEVGMYLHDELLSTTLGTPPATTANDRIVLVSVASGPGFSHSVLMREGDQAVDTVGAPITGVFYGSPTIAQGFSSTGFTAFSTVMTGAVTTTTDDAVFVGTPGSVQMVLRAGDVAPGTGGELIGVPNSTIRYTDAGVAVGCSLAASPTVNTSNDSILLLCKPGSAPIKIAREGDPAPGFPVGWVFGAIGGSTNFGSSTQGLPNARGQLMFTSMRVNDGTNERNTLYSWDPVHGLQPQLVQGDTFGGQLVDFLPGSVLQFPGADGSSLGFTTNGDFVTVPNTATSNFLARGHVGSLIGTPSSVPIAGGTQNLEIDCGPGFAFNFYLVLASDQGTRPGFPNPLNFALNVPLNFGGSPSWIDLSFNLANSPVWGNTLSFTDAAGKATASFTMPAGYPMFQGIMLHHAAALFDFSLVGTFVTEPTSLRVY
ncbi:MAG: hypothetical protein JNL08_04345 [Planctomycetes bacterium]|nr:hypothetical protein [Planctomycetota bacterium]